MSATEAEQLKRELRTLNVAICANILICVAKVWVHLISGSSAMLAEALHSVADILNQVLLRVGVLAAMKAPSARHPYGYMRDRFVWSLISAVGIFFLGAGASVFHGLHTLTDLRVVEGAFWSYLVLGVSGLLEGYSLWVALKCVMEGARARGMRLVPYITSGQDPTTVAVLLEDGGAVAGLGIAAVCTALTHATGNAAWDAVGSIAVGGLLGLIAVFLVQKNRDLLLGRSMSPAETEAVLRVLKNDPVVLYVADPKTEELGPRVYRFKAEVAWNGEALVARYLARCGRDALAHRLREALDADQRAAAAALQGAADGEARGSAQQGGGSAGGDGGPGRAVRAYWDPVVGGACVGGEPAQGASAYPPGGALDDVLKRYGRDIINAVGAEVDRIEAEIQAINPGIRYVDLETDRGRGAGPPAVLQYSPPGSAALPPVGSSSSGEGAGGTGSAGPGPGSLTRSVGGGAGGGGGAGSAPVPTTQGSGASLGSLEGGALYPPGRLPGVGVGLGEYACTVWDFPAAPEPPTPLPQPPVMSEGAGGPHAGLQGGPQSPHDHVAGHAPAATTPVVARAPLAGVGAGAGELLSDDAAGIRGLPGGQGWVIGGPAPAAPPVNEPVPRT